MVPKVRTAAVKASPSTISSLCPPRPRLSPRRIFSRGPAAISTSAMSISAIGSRQAQLLAEITAPELDHQIAQAQATLKQTEATLQQNQANMELASVTWQRDKPLVEKGWVTLQQGDIDTKTLQGAAGRGRRGAIECHCPAGANRSAATAERLSERRGPVRRRRYAAQHRCRQPGAGRRYDRHLHVHCDADRT